MRQNLGPFGGGPVELRVADQLGDEPVDREGGAVELDEALLDGGVSVLEQQVGQHRVGEQRAAGATATAIERMGYLMAPGKRAELIAALPSGFEEADPDLVDGEGVMAQRPRRLPWAEQLRALAQLADLDGEISAVFAQEPQAPGCATGLGMADQPGSLQVGGVEEFCELRFRGQPC